MRILLTGAYGQLGEALQPRLAALGEVIAVGRDRVDLAQTDRLVQVVCELEPTVIVNAAAYTAVDKAEADRDLAWAVNALAPGRLAEAAQQLGAKLIHVSTDYVFNGTAGSPYRETDPTEPLGVYGQSKRAGEEAIAATGAEAAIVRTAWVYGAGKTANFVKTMLRLAADRPELRVVADQIGTPTWTGDLAATLADVVTHLGPETAGIYHYTNSGAASWYDFAVAIFEEARAIDWPGLAIERVVPIATADYPTPARRPAYSVLWGGRIADLLGRTAPHWRSSLRQMLIEYKKQIHS